MFGKIVYISDSIAHISIPNGTPVGMDLMNMHVIFEDGDRKVLGEVEDVAKCVLWLVQDNYTTGQIISVNGGWVI